MEKGVPARDIMWGKICRWLRKHNLEMHTPMKGETWICKRKPRPVRATPTTAL